MEISMISKLMQVLLVYMLLKVVKKGQPIRDINKQFVRFCAFAVGSSFIATFLVMLNMEKNEFCKVMHLANLNKTSVISGLMHVSLGLMKRFSLGVFLTLEIWLHALCIWCGLLTNTEYVSQIDVTEVFDRYDYSWDVLADGLKLWYNAAIFFNTLNGFKMIIMHVFFDNDRKIPVLYTFLSFFVSTLIVAGFTLQIAVILDKELCLLTNVF